MNISSGSSDHSEQSKEDRSYNHKNKDDVAVFTVKDKPMRELNQSSGGKEDLAMVSPLIGKRKGKKKLLKEMHVDSDGKIIKKTKKSVHISKSKKVMSDTTRNNSKRFKKVKSPVRTPAMIRAEEVRSSLGTKFPTFIKPLLKSHVSGGFWMGLPVQFCKSHLLDKDMDIALENENRERFYTKYLANKLGLSGGWRNFSITQKLVEGDVAIFQLVKSNRFKMYIIKEKNLNEANGHGQHGDTEKAGTKDCEKALAQNITKRKRSDSLQSSKVRKNKKIDLEKPVPKSQQLAKFCKNSDKKTYLEVIPSPRSPSSQVQFKAIKSFEDFSIIVDELCIDPDLPDHIRAKYYKLCSDKKSFLHDRLMHGLSSKIIAGIINQVVCISESLKQCCSLTTCHNEFSIWDKALESFEYLGMNVGFLRSRIKTLVAEFESEGAAEARKYIEAKLGRIRVEDEMRPIEAKLIVLKDTYKKYDAEVKALKSRAERYEHKLREVIDAPW